VGVADGFPYPLGVEVWQRRNVQLIAFASLGGQEAIYLRLPSAPSITPLRSVGGNINVANPSPPENAPHKSPDALRSGERGRVTKCSSIPLKIDCMASRGVCEGLIHLIGVNQVIRVIKVYLIR